MKYRHGFVTNSSSSSFLITNNSNKTMTSKEVVLSLISGIIEDAEDRFELEPGESIRYECGSNSCDGAFENFIHNEFRGWGHGGHYSNGEASVILLEDYH